MSVSPNNGRLPSTLFVVARQAGAYAMTDRGTPIPLFRYELAFPEGGQDIAFKTAAEQPRYLQKIEARFFENAEQDLTSFSRETDPDLASNCHGWIFAEGRFGIEDDYLELILRDNGYQTVDSPRDGDLGIHRHSGKILHSSLVCENAAGEMMLRSKFGPFGAFQHSSNVYPFVRGCDSAFYRAARTGHSLRVIAAAYSERSAVEASVGVRSL